MSHLMDTDIEDFMTTTLRDLGRMKFGQIAQELQDYEVMSKWLKKDKVQFSDGAGIQRTLMVKTGGAAAHVGLFDEEEVNITDLLKNITIPWRQARTFWAWERRTLMKNKGKSRINDYIKPQRAGAMIDLAEELETKAWTLPEPSATVDPWGIPYWVVKNSATGFNGGYPSGYTTIAGLSLTDAPKFYNYTGTYENVTKADLIKSMRTSHRKCRFKSPVSIPEFRGGKGTRYRYYMNEATISVFEELGEAQNENLGRDLAPFDDQMTFRRHPIIWVPQLDADSTNPVYQIDHSTFYPVVLKGDYLRESDSIRTDANHNVYKVFVDLSYNYLCTNRRGNAVLYQV